MKKIEYFNDYINKKIKLVENAEMVTIGYDADEDNMVVKSRHPLQAHSR